ncbi:MAG: ROK family transcriptional regulator [Chloroflexi bacterium]|nr:MAG: ROK family transcriptional regulator [Chloroflexota bacterium]
MGRKNSVDHSDMRDMNLALILNTLYKDAPLSRALLAARTGLNKATVSSIVKDLLALSLVRELGIDVSSTDVGRPAINLEPNSHAGYMIGIEIGVDFISLIVVNFAIEVVSRRYESTAKLYNQQAVLDRALFLLDESCEQVRKMKRPLFGIGIGVPGLVDVTTGKLLFAPNMGWQDVPLKEMVKAKFNVPVFLANEANLAALGESQFGAGVDSNFMVYLNSDVGLGGGIVLNGNLLHGASGFAGEVGHMTVERDGRPCNCGNRGCWETVAGRQALYRRIEEAISGGQTSWITAQIDGDFKRLSIPMIVEAAKQDDPVAVAALHETGEWLGIGIASLLNVINPQRVILGGSLSAAEAFVLPVVRETINRRALRWVREKVDIVTAKHGEDAAVMGCIAILFQNVIENPRKWMQETAVSE